jgi:ParB/RepB/Spo0J family partition protein
MTAAEQVQQITLEKITPHPDNRRVGGFDPVKLEQLAASIKEVGIQQPIIVRKQQENGGFELVAGERRWRAAKLAGLSQVPAIVRELDDLQVLKVQTIENLQREDVHPLDEADGYARLMEKAGYEVDQVAQELGKSVSYVYQRLKLRDLVPGARDLFVKGEITAGHAILIARLAPDQQQQCVKEGLRKGWQEDDVPSVRSLDGWIRQNILMDLSKVTWKPDDAELVPAAGSCLACPKRTGFHPQLFADVCTGKKDFCTDAKCFAAKASAIVERRRAELKDVPHLEVLQGNIGYSEEQKLEKKGILGSYDWQECKAKEKGAQRVLVVAGDAPGRLTWGKKHARQSYSSYKASPAEKARQEKEKQDRKIKTAAHDRVWGEVKSVIISREDLGAEMLSFVAIKYCGQWPGMEAVDEEYGWKSQKKKDQAIRAMDLSGLVKLLLIASIGGEKGYSGYGYEGQTLAALAEYLGIDAKRIAKEARAELAQKAKGPKLTKVHQSAPKLTNVSADGKAAAKKKAHVKDPEYVDMLQEEAE